MMLTCYLSEAKCPRDENHAEKPLFGAECEAHNA